MPIERKSTGLPILVGARAYGGSIKMPEALPGLAFGQVPPMAGTVSMQDSQRFKALFRSVERSSRADISIGLLAHRLLPIDLLRERAPLLFL